MLPRWVRYSANVNLWEWKAAFSAKPASLYGAEDMGGHTLLQRALTTKNIGMIGLLLKQGTGADTLAVNQKKNNNPADRFWGGVLSNGILDSAAGRYH